MSRFNVLLTDYAWADVDIERSMLATIDAELVVAPDTDEQTLCRLAGEADAVMTNWASVSSAVIDAASRCRIVARLGIGLDNIDVAAATRRGIPVTNIPDYCITEVAEHTLALLFALARGVAFFHHETKQGDYRLTAGPVLRRVSGKTLGIIGFGHIGRRVASLAKCLGMSVVAHGPRLPADLPIDVAWRSLPQLLAQSDFVSLHVPLVPETTALIDQSAFSLMRSTAHLINTSRGGVIDHAALADALFSDRLAGAALDVHEPEPPDLTSPLYRDQRVIVTPHAGFASEESITELRSRATAQVVAVLRGERPENVVNVAFLHD